MSLSEYQYSVLSEMGIPIWTIRQSKNTEVIEPTNSQSLDDLQTDVLQIPDEVQLVIVVESIELSTIERRLLTSILKSVGLDSSSQYLLDVSAIDCIAHDVIHSKLVLILTEQEPSLSEHIQCVQLPSLATMIRQPTLKAVAWQQLKSQNYALS